MEILFIFFLGAAVFYVWNRGERFERQLRHLNERFEALSRDHAAVLERMQRFELEHPVISRLQADSAHQSNH